LRTKMWLPIAMFLAGAFTIAYAVASGKADVSLVVIFPVFSGSSGIFLLGILLIVASFFVGFGLLAMAPAELEEGTASTMSQVSNQTKRETKFGGVVLIGPIPIAFGSDKNLALAMLVVGIILAVAFVVALFAFG
jgi:uncharacterized protein (TIGR00304 family)